MAGIAAREADRRVRARLAEYYHPDEVDAWMAWPHPQLGGRAPYYAIEQGDAALVHAIIDRIDADAFL